VLLNGETHPERNIARTPPSPIDTEFMETNLSATLNHARQLGRQRLTALSAAFLARHAPFDRIGAELLAQFAEQAEQVHFPPGAEIVSPQNPSIDSGYILDQGSILRLSGDDTPSMLTPGACFPLGALISGQSADASYRASGECFCYRLPAAVFRQMLELSPEFAQHCARELAWRLGEARQRLADIDARRGGEQRTQQRPLKELIRRTPVTLPAETPIETALQRLSAEKIGSLAIADAEGKPLGILTRHDLLDRVILAGIDRQMPIERIMSGDPVTLSEQATVYDATLTMAARGIRHLLIVDEEGHLSGVVSERDLFALQRSGVWQIRQSIDAATNLDRLQHAATEVRQLARDLLAQGMASAQLTQSISVLNDALTRRVLAFNLEQHDLFNLDWCWLAFGSEGRDEQTLSSDQDNGIIFACNDFSDRDELRLRFLDFARDVNRDLDRIGFPLCKGNIMASNPQWCLTLGEWQEQFSRWVQSPEPEALLNATIFFDFRPLYGKTDLAERLRHHLLALTTSTPLFLKAMAANALDVEPPLATFRDFRTDLEPGHPGTIDLKKYGSRLFVDAARILALATGVRGTNTAQRLRQGGARLSMRNEEITAMIEAFDFIQRLRLRNPSARPGEERSGDNRIVPGELNELDRQILKESFKQARKLQLRLKLDYQT